MTINLQRPDITELKPRITVFGVGGGGGNAVNNMINAGLLGVDFVVANTDAQALTQSKADRVIQMGVAVTGGLGAGAHPDMGCAAAEECIDEIVDHLSDAHMIFVTAGMGGGTGTGAAPVIARAARERGILTVGVVTKPFHFEGARRMKTAEQGIKELQESVDTLIVIPNQNLFRIANEKTTFADAFAMADQVLYSGVASITDLMIKEGLINLDFADVRSVMHEMGRAMMGTGEASGEGRALAAAEAAIANPLLDDTSMRGARGLLISITGGPDMGLFEVDEAANRIREEVDQDANVIFGAIVDESLEGVMRVSVVATGIDRTENEAAQPLDFVTPARSSAPAAPKESKPAAPASQPKASIAEPLEESVKPIDEVMERIEAEMSIPAPEPFRPQNHIFKPAPSAAEAPRPIVSRANPRPASQQAALQAAIEEDFIEFDAEEMEAVFQPMLEQQGQQARPQQRVPELDEFPAVARQKVEGHNDADQGPRSLWKKLTQGLIHRDEPEPVARLEPASQVQKPQAPRQAQAPRPQPQQARPASAEDSVYTQRRNPQVQPQARTQRTAVQEEEQLEIPAFLRRQAN